MKLISTMVDKPLDQILSEFDEEVKIKLEEDLDFFEATKTNENFFFNEIPGGLEIAANPEINFRSKNNKLYIESEYFLLSYNQEKNSYTDETSGLNLGYVIGNPVPQFEFNEWKFKFYFAEQGSKQFIRPHVVSSHSGLLIPRNSILKNQKEEILPHKFLIGY